MFHVKHCVELLRLVQIFAAAGSFSYECVCSFDHFIARMHVIPEHQECLECLNPWMPGQSSSFFKICSLWFTNIDVTW